MKINRSVIRRTVGFCTALLILGSVNAPQAHAEDPPVKITAALSHPYILSGERQTVYLKIGLRGTKPPELDNLPRAAINLALVLDKSGSMSGQKIEDVKQAAKMMIDRLQPMDTLSVVTYDNTANILLPASRLENPELIKQQIDTITAFGGTALYDGVMNGAQQIRSYISDHQINRVILLSDGLANEGPQAPHELGQVGQNLIREGISVSTIGIGTGYNEDLMSTLAAKSDGFHRFLENTEDLYETLDWEVGKMSSVVASNVQVMMNFPFGVRPLSVGREGTINGQDVSVNMNQVYAEHEIYVLTELEITPDFSGNLEALIANIGVNYHDIYNKKDTGIGETVKANVTSDRTLANANLNRDVLIAVNEQNAAAIQKTAIDLRDQGKVNDAKALLDEMAETLKKAGELLASPRLTKYSETLEQSAQTIEDDAKWNENRKENTSTLYSVSFNVT